MAGKSLGGNIRFNRCAAPRAIDNADGHLEYRAGEAFNFDLPSSLSADTIILDLGPALKVQGTLTATDLVELSSDTNVYIVGGTIQSDGGGDVANMRVIARGTRDSTSAVYHEGTGLQIYVNFGAWPTWTCVSHFPEVVFFVKF